jgi:small basic protein
MIVALCILTYLFIGWIVASVCLTWSIRTNPKRTPDDDYIDFVVSFFFWWLVLAALLVYCAVEISLWLGRKTRIFITKNMKGDNK